MVKLEIVSGKESRHFWNEINAINDLSHGEDIKDVMYSMACKMQEMEDEIEKLINMPAIAKVLPDPEEKPSTGSE